MTDTCTKCGQTYPVSEFVRSRQAKRGYIRHCKPCEKLRGIQKRTGNAESARTSKLKNVYGITPDVYDLIAIGQGLVCRICGLPESGKRLAVDHCHTTNRVRGLLCQACNTAIGLLKEDIRILESAIRYLRGSP